MFLFKKNKHLLNKLEEYLEMASQTVDTFQEAIKYLIDNKIDEHFKTLANKTHKFESNADDIRRTIELEMYAKSLLPETREDLLTIIEHLDKIPSSCETILNMIITQKTDLYRKIDKQYRELLKLSIETFGYALDATRDCFGKREKISEYNKLVDNNESLGDAIERKMITKVFNSDLSVGHKILQKELINNLGDICDHCENVLDRIVICSVKREF